jgi:hypothetical protein
VPPSASLFGDVELDKVKEDLQSSGYEEFFNPLWATLLIEAAKSTHKLQKTNWHQVEAVAQRAFKQRRLIAAELMSTIESSSQRLGAAVRQRRRAHS